MKSARAAFKASLKELADRSYELLEYVYGLLENGADRSALRSVDGAEITYHSHCQQRTLGLEAHTIAVLEDCGYDVVTTDAECCGMAGSFGYKSDFYELSMDVGARLRGNYRTRASATAPSSRAGFPVSNRSTPFSSASPAIRSSCCETNSRQPQAARRGVRPGRGSFRDGRMCKACAQGKV